MARLCLALCCALLPLSDELVLRPATKPLGAPKLALARRSQPRLAAKPRPGSRPARGGGGGGGFGASPAGGSKPTGAATGAKSEAAELRAAAKAYARLNAESALATDVYVRATAGEEWLKTGSVAVGEGGSLMQAAYAQRRLVIRHATKISKRLALRAMQSGEDIVCGLQGPYGILAVTKPAELLPDIDCGFRGDVSEFLEYAPAEPQG